MMSYIKIKRTLLLVCLSGSINAGAQKVVISRETDDSCSNGANIFSYQNPISKGLDMNGVRDCQVFRDVDCWYLTATAYPHWERQETIDNLNQGVPLYKSTDLLNWQFINYIIQRPDSTAWYYRRFWAPEIQKIRGRYYATFNCSNPKHGYPGQWMGYAVADRVEGPYTVVTKNKPLGNGNDLTFFEDTDGKVYACFNRERDFGIRLSEIDLEKGEFIGEQTLCIASGRSDFEYDANGVPVKEPGKNVPKIKTYHEWDAIGIEGAYIIKRNGIYYMFYSSWTRGYEIGYATARNIRGPWKKYADNPIYGAMNKKKCQERGIVWSGDEHSPFNHVGHNEIFVGPDGRFWLSCHGTTNDNPERPLLMIDPIDFDNSGNIQKRTPSYTIQNVIIKK